MYINKINSVNNYSTSFQAKKLRIDGKKFVSLSGYNKPLLELTEQENRKISEIERQIKQIQEYIAKRNNSTNYAEYTEAMRRKLNTHIIMEEQKITELREVIRRIKKARYTQQLAEFNNK